MTTPYYQDDAVTLWHGDALATLRELPDRSVDCCVTSPPYFGLRDYGVDGQIGAEASPAEFVAALVAVFAEVRRVLADDGTLWLNLGDSYSTRKVQRDSSHQPGMHAHRTDHETIGRSWVENRKAGVVRMPSDAGVPEKNLIGIPWRTAFALQDDGWILRNDIIWAKPNGMPESVTDRLSTKHEHVFLFAKSRRYWFDLDPVREPLAFPEALTEGKVFGGKNKQWSAARPQKRRAQELFDTAGLTDEHLAAMRAVGMSDAGKAKAIQSGSGRNAAETQRLADEAKAALGGYYREFLYDGGRNPGDVWTIPTTPTGWAHFATMPPALAERCVLAGCKPGGIVLDPFSGSGTTGYAATKHGRRYVGIDLNREYLDLSLRTRLAQGALIDEVTA